MGQATLSLSFADSILDETSASDFPLVSEPPVIRNEEEVAVGAVLVGRPISVDITVATDAGISDEIVFTAIVELRDRDDITVEIQWRSGSVSSASDRKVSFYWTPTIAGEYSVRTLLISSFENPELLSGVSSSSVQVARDSSQLEELLREWSGSAENGQVKDAKDYTLMVYMVGADLETFGYFATEDIHEMMSIGSTDSVNVIIETGGALDALEDEYRMIDFTSVQTHKVVKNDVERLRDLGEQNMGDPKTLADFLVYGVSNFPADHYAVVLWSDGGGINGFGTDTVSGDSLSLEELQGAFSEARDMTGAHYEIIGFDACLMASIEVMTRLDQYANYMVSSEELEPGWGWDYAAILDRLTQDSKMSGSDLGVIIADSYALHIETTAAQYDDYDSQETVTMSVVDLKKIRSVENTLVDLSRSLNGELNDISAAHAFARTVGTTERFGIGTDRSSGHVDLSHLSLNLADQFPSLRKQSDELESAINDAVIYTVSRELHPNSSGISIYMPLQDYDSDLENSQNSILGWWDLVQTYSSLLAQDVVPPRVTIDWNIKDKIYGTTQSDDVDRIQLFIYREAIEGVSIEVLSFVEDDISFDSEDRYEYPFDQQLISLCNDMTCIPASMYVERSGTTRYGLFPVRLETNTIDSDMILIYQINSTGGFDFIGAWPGIDEDGNVSRELWPLQDGDRIHSKGYILDRRSGDDHNKPIEVGSIDVTGNFGPAYHDLEGAFYLSAALCDYSGNCEYSRDYRFVNTDDS